MADRFDEMAQNQVFTLRWPPGCANDLATALRELAAAEREAGAADLRERLLKGFETGLQMSHRSWTAPVYEAVKERAVEIARSLPLTTPKET